MKRKSLALGLICLSAVASAEPGYEWAVLAPTISIESDSDDFYAQKIGAGALFQYESPLNYTGVHAAEHHYTDDNWSINATQLSLVNRAINLQDGLGRDLKLGVSSVESDQLLIADMSYSTWLQKNTSVGVFLNRDWVETELALEDGVHYSYAGASIEQKVGDDWTVIGLTSQHRFSDNNTRTHIRARLIYDVLPEYGVHLQYRHRQYSNTDGVSPYYFNPDHYKEDMLAIGFRKNIQRWRLTGLAGYGLEKVASADRESTHLYELGLESPISSSIVLNTHFTAGDSATISGPDYRFRIFQTALIFAF